MTKQIPVIVMFGCGCSITSKNGKINGKPCMVHRNEFVTKTKSFAHKAAVLMNQMIVQMRDDTNWEDRG